MARDEMLARSHTDYADGRSADDKRSARLNVMRDILSRLHYAGKDDKLVRPDAETVFRYDDSRRTRGMLAA